ncbi:MAG: hypothetical protein PWP67_2660, partial [Clostridium butyricum]|nr:hypothetical protein [Clostridium butyricum]
YSDTIFITFSRMFLPPFCASVAISPEVINFIFLSSLYFQISYSTPLNNYKFMYVIICYI